MMERRLDQLGQGDRDARDLELIGVAGVVELAPALGVRRWLGHPSITIPLARAAAW
jgi:hypothetical protein